MAERQLPKLNVAGSIPVSRSTPPPAFKLFAAASQRVAHWTRVCVVEFQLTTGTKVRGYLC